MNKVRKYISRRALLLVMFLLPHLVAAEAITEKIKIDSNDKKTYGDWVDILKAEHEVFLTQHPDLYDIEVGAALHCKLSLHQWHYKPEIPHDLEQLTKIGKKYYNAFVAFMDSARGKAMFAKFKKDGRLNPEDQAYYWVVKATVDTYPYHKRIGTPADKTALEKLKKFGTEFATKAYKRQLFTRSEMKQFRDYLAIVPKGGTTAHWAAKKFTWSRDDLDKAMKRHSPATGIKAPDHKFHYFETLAKQRGYTAYDAYDLSIQSYLTPNILECLELVLDCYKYEVVDGEPRFSADFSDFEKLKKNEYFSLHEQVKTGRPFYLFTHNFTDSSDFTRRTGYQEALYWLFKDEVDFFHTGRLDFGFGACEYFGQFDVFSGMYPNRVIHTGYSSPENLYSPKFGHISAIPKGYLRLPTKSVPILINLGSRIREIGCGGPVAFIDINGVQSNYLSSKENDTFWHAKNINNQAMRTDNIPKGYSIMEKFSLRKAIRFFKIMETLNWQYDAKSELLKSHYADIEDTTYHDFKEFSMKKAQIVKVDLENKQIHVRGKVSNAPKPIEETHVLTFGKHLFICSKDNTIKDIKQGDTVRVSFKFKPGDRNTKILQYLWKGNSPGSGQMGHQEGVFLNGKITAVDLDKYQCTVVMPKPDVAKGEWKGFDMYENELKPLGMSEPSDTVGSSLGWNFCKKLYYGTDEDRTFILKIDDFVDVSVNGRLSTLEEVAVGDRVVFGISTFFSRKTDEHPYYSPYGVYVVKDGPLTGDELIFKPGE